MQFEITRLSTNERTYVVMTAMGTRYGVHDFELERWLRNLGVGDSTIAAVLDVDPNETIALQVAKAA